MQGRQQGERKGVNAGVKPTDRQQKKARMGGEGVARTTANSGGNAAGLQRIDAWEFARSGRRVQGISPQMQFRRLLDALHAESVGHDDQRAFVNVGSEPQAAQPAVVQWSIEGQADRDGRCAIRLTGQFDAHVTCMRCSEPLGVSIEFDRRLRLCKSEQEADQLETAEDEDAVAAPGRVDLMQWLEDELLLSLPMFPVHEVCQTLPVSSDGETPVDEIPIDEMLAQSRTDRQGAQASPGESSGQAAASATNAGSNAVENAAKNAAKPAATQPDGGAEETHRPFETLARLMKKSDKP